MRRLISNNNKSCFTQYQGRKLHKGIFQAIIMALFLMGAITRPASANTLEDVKAKGFLHCGVSQGLQGFSMANRDGVWSGIDADFCRALAAAIFGDPQKVKFSPLSTQERFTALQSGEIDILSRNTTWTMGRDASLGLNFAGIYYFDGQGFMAHKKLGIASSLELSGATICSNTGTTTELNIADYFISKKIPYKILTFKNRKDVLAAYESGQCGAYSADASALAALRLTLKQPENHIILPETISKEPLGPVVRQGDDQWFNIVRWVLFALLSAEELGISSQNINEMASSKNPAVMRFLGTRGDLGQKLGLQNKWAEQVIRAVGHYGEVFERNLGKNSPLKIQRRENKLWLHGGLLYAPPMR